MTAALGPRLALHAASVAALIEQRLDVRTQVPPRLAAAMRHGVLSGGKRLRPFLVIETAALFGLAAPAALPAAAALECIHCYSLIHDDLPAMDNDAMRRGQPSVWAAFDEWTAILAGDALLTLAFEILAEPETHPDANVRIALTRALAIASGGIGMVGGQCLDLEADKLGQPSRPDVAHIRRLQAMKTGALLVHGVEAGALLGGADATAHAALVRYGTALGLAFQIADDLLDVEGDPTKLGKATGKDEAAGKATLVSLLGIEAARAELNATLASALAALDPFGAAAEPLRQVARFVAERDH